MSSENLGLQREYFEKQFGLTAKSKIDEDAFQYAIGECALNIEYSKDQAIASIEIENISKQCDFDTKNIFLSGKASDLTYGELVKYYGFEPLSSCYSGCGNAYDPSYGVFVEGPRAVNYFQLEASTKYNGAEGVYDSALKAKDSVKSHFSEKYPNFDFWSGDDLGPISSLEFSQVWIDKFKDVKISSIKFGYSIKENKEKYISFSGGLNEKIEQADVDLQSDNNPARKSDPYWKTVQVDLVRASENIQSQKPYLIDGSDWQVEYMHGYQAFSMEFAENIRQAFISKAPNGIPILQYFDCPNRLSKFDGKNEQWYKLKPKTVAARILASVCALPSSQTGTVFQK
jgi:hypothetical protein